MIVLKTKFTQCDKDGDFEWMIKQKEHRNSLFIFNENFKDSCNQNLVDGGGTAVLRKYCWRFQTRPLSHGICTGWSKSSGAFEDLNYYSLRCIEINFQRLYHILRNYIYDKIIFSADDEGLLGCSIFDVPRNIRLFITKRLEDLGTSIPRPEFEMTKLSVFEEEQMTPISVLHHNNSILAKQYEKLKKEHKKLKGLKRKRTTNKQ